MPRLERDGFSIWPSGMIDVCVAAYGREFFKLKVFSMGRCPAKRLYARLIASLG